MVGNDKLELCIIYDDWEDSRGRYRHGLTTHFLRHAKVDEKLNCNMNAGSVTIPEGQTKPYIMVGLGTGMAPLRAMIQDRAVAKTNGEECGPMALFFGNRNAKNEFLYKDEIEGYVKDGVTDFFGAWSRDQKEKIYVHHLMKKQENKELI